MATKIEIVNLALTKIGARRLVSLEAEAESARIVKAVFDPVRDEVMEAVNWNFARRSASLALIKGVVEGVQPIQGWNFTYAIPANSLKVRKVYADGMAYKAKDDDFIETLNPAADGQVIATDVELAICDYTFRVTDPTQFSPAFVNAIAFRLAQELAFPITGDVQIAGQMAGGAQAAIEEAARKDHGRDKDKPQEPSEYVDARG